MYCVYVLARYSPFHRVIHFHIHSFGFQVTSPPCLIFLSTSVVIFSLCMHIHITLTLDKPPVYELSITTLCVSIGSCLQSHRIVQFFEDGHFMPDNFATAAVEVVSTWPAQDCLTFFCQGSTMAFMFVLAWWRHAVPSTIWYMAMPCCSHLCPEGAHIGIFLGLISFPI